MIRFSFLRICVGVFVVGLGACDAAADGTTIKALRACGLTAGEEHTVRETVDGDTFVLDDGRQVRVVGLQAPKLPLGRKNFDTWPLADEAKQALSEMALGRRVRLLYGGSREDRHGRILAHALVVAEPGADSGVWMQHQMLKVGMARVYSFRDNRSCLSPLLDAEREARRDEVGIWGDDYYSVRSPQDTHDDLDSFQLVEGRVVDAAQVSSGVYLNFGRDWRRDFTIFVANRDLKRFDKAGVDLMTLDGARIRTRGWLDYRNGPMIEVTHPEQIEVLK